MLAIERWLMTKQRRSFSTEFKREAAGLVLNQGYSHIEASRSLGRSSPRCVAGLVNSSRSATALLRRAKH